VGIAAAAVMSDPAIVGVHVRSVGMPVVVAIAAVFVSVSFVTPLWAGTMFRDVLATVVMPITITAVVFLAPVLSKGREGDHHRCRKNR
jgi:hypothetical protein